MVLEAADAGTRSYARYRRYLIALLLVVCLLNYLDRQIIVILSEPIKHEFKLKDWQLGAVTGLSFALLYSVLGIPVARFADKGRRAFVVSLSLTVWSVFTIVCGLAHNFLQLALARMFVGIGESGGSAPAQALVVEYTPKEHRASAIAIYSTGIPLGTLFGLLLGGLAADAYGWRAAFFIAGAPGLLLAALAAITLREPPQPKHVLESATHRGAITEMFSNRSFVLVLIGGSFVSFLNYGQGTFFPSFLLRDHGLALDGLARSFALSTGIHMGRIGFLGTTLGIISGSAGIAGNLAGGFLTDRLARTDIRAYVDVQAIAIVLRVPAFILAMLAPNVSTVLALLGVQLFFSGMAGAPSYASIQTLVRPANRSTAAAVFLFGLNAFGLGFGPLLVGLLSDSLATGGFGSAEGLRWALLFSQSLMLVPIACFFLARRTFHIDAMS